MGHAPLITRSKDDLPLPEGPIILLTTVCEDTITRNTNATGHAQQVLSLVHLETQVAEQYLTRRGSAVDTLELHHRAVTQPPRLSDGVIEPAVQHTRGKLAESVVSPQRRTHLMRSTLSSMWPTRCA